LLKHKLIKGAIWNSISQFGSQAINFILIIILARLLMPKDFGLLGQVGVITSLMGYFTEFGIVPSLIQKKSLNKTDCDTAFFGMFFFALIGYVTVYLIAPLVSLFYGDDSLVLLTRVVFIQFLIAPISLVNEALERKQLNYNRITFAELSSLFISGIVGIVLAYKGHGVWSLVWQSLLKVLIRSSIIIHLTDWRPGLSFSFNCFINYTKSGAHFTYRNITMYLSENMDFLIIGKLLGPGILGIYNLAFRMSNYPFAKVQQIFGQMLFPAFSSFNDDITRMRNNYFKLSFYGGVFLIPLLIIIYFSIGDIVNLLLGDKWIETIPVVKVLVIYLLFSSISFADEPLLIAVNKIKSINVIKTLITLFLIVAGYYFTLKYGIIGMAVTLTVLSIINVLFVKILLIKSLNINIFEYVRIMIEPILIMVSCIIFFSLYNYFTQFFLLSSVSYLIGISFLFIIIMGFYLIWKGIIDINRRNINFEAF